jgi:hypothetical protein
MSSRQIEPSLPSIDNNDEYLQVTQADLDRARFRVGLELEADEDETERMQLANSAKLRLILDEAEARIRATGGIMHKDFWSQLDAEYQGVEMQGNIAATNEEN